MCGVKIQDLLCVCIFGSEFTTTHNQLPHRLKELIYLYIISLYIVKVNVKKAYKYGCIRRIATYFSFTLGANKVGLHQENVTGCGITYHTRN